MEFNPYQPPKADITQPETEAEILRKKYLSHELNVQSLGTLYVIGGILITAGGVVSVFTAANSMSLSSLTIGTGGAALGVLQLFTANWLRQLNPRGRVLAGVFAGIGVFAFPLGTIISAFIMYLLFSEKGRVVFSPEYAAVRAQTPHIKYRTSPVLKGCLIIFVVLVILMFVFWILFPLRTDALKNPVNSP